MRASIDNVETFDAPNMDLTDVREKFTKKKRVTEAERRTGMLNKLYQWQTLTNSVRKNVT